MPHIQPVVNRRQMLSQAGAGFGAGFDSGYSSLFGAGIVGIEYNFDAPILISLDYRIQCIK